MTGSVNPNTADTGCSLSLFSVVFFCTKNNSYRQSVRYSSYHDGPGNQLAYTLLRLGRTNEANTILDSNLTKYKKASAELTEHFNNPLAVATVYAVRGNTNEALFWLRIAIVRGLRDYRWLKVEPLFDSLRRDPRFEEIINNLRSRIEEMRAKAEQRRLIGQ